LLSPVIEGGEIGDNTLIDSVSGIASVGTYTYLGDMNLDGQVTGDDYTIIDANLNTNPPVGIAWLSGDPNLDGVVTADDSTVIDANLGLGAGNPLGPTHLLNSFAFPASETSTPALREDLLDAWLERPSQLYRNQKGAIQLCRSGNRHACRTRWGGATDVSLSLSAMSGCLLCAGEGESGGPAGFGGGEHLAGFGELVGDRHRQRGLVVFELLEGGFGQLQLVLLDVLRDLIELGLGLRGGQGRRGRRGGRSAGTRGGRWRRARRRRWLSASGSAWSVSEASPAWCCRRCRSRTRAVWPGSMRGRDA
jgi:hypothetical protein